MELLSRKCIFFFVSLMLATTLAECNDAACSSLENDDKVSDKITANIFKRNEILVKSFEYDLN